MAFRTTPLVAVLAVSGALVLVAAPASAQRAPGQGGGAPMAGASSGNFGGGGFRGGGSGFSGRGGGAPVASYSGGGGRYYGGGGYRGGGRYYNRGPSAAGIGFGLAAGALIGSAIVGSSPYYHDEVYAYDDAPGYVVAPGGGYVAPGGDDVTSCAARFRSYDPASGTYLGYDGLRHPCS
jgi:hypothetical protein